MKKKNNYMTKHHLIPRHMGPVDYEDNITRLRNDKHVNLHGLFDQNGKAVLPHEQLKYLIEINKKVLNQRFLNELEILVNTHAPLIYKNGLFRLIDKS